MPNQDRKRGPVACDPVDRRRGEHRTGERRQNWSADFWNNATPAMLNMAGRRRPNNERRREGSDRRIGIVDRRGPVGDRRMRSEGRESTVIRTPSPAGGSTDLRVVSLAHDQAEEDPDEQHQSEGSPPDRALPKRAGFKRPPGPRTFTPAHVREHVAVRGTPLGDNPMGTTPAHEIPSARIYRPQAPPINHEQELIRSAVERVTFSRTRQVIGEKLAGVRDWLGDWFKEIKEDLNK